LSFFLYIQRWLSFLLVTVFHVCLLSSLIFHLQVTLSLVVISVLSIFCWILVSPEVLGDHKGALCLDSHWSDLTVSHGVLISQAIHLQAQCYCHSENEPALQGCIVFCVLLTL
jgi:hypothetical protein